MSHPDSNLSQRHLETSELQQSGPSHSILTRARALAFVLLPVVACTPHGQAKEVTPFKVQEGDDAQLDFMPGDLRLIDDEEMIEDLERPTLFPDTSRPEEIDLGLNLTPLYFTLPEGAVNAWKSDEKTDEWKMLNAMPGWKNVIMTDADRQCLVAEYPDGNFSRPNCADLIEEEEVCFEVQDQSGATTRDCVSAVKPS